MKAIKTIFEWFFIFTSISKFGSKFALLECIIRAQKSIFYRITDSIDNDKNSRITLYVELNTESNVKKAF